MVQELRGFPSMQERLNNALHAGKPNTSEFDDQIMQEKAPIPPASSPEKSASTPKIKEESKPTNPFDADPLDSSGEWSQTKNAA